jgi:hypothetical protein
LKPAFLLPLIAALVLLSSQAPLPSPEHLAALLDRAQAKFYDASLITLADGSSWIKTQADIEGVFPGTVDDAVAVFKDYENSPKVFSRVASVKVRTRGPDFVVTEQLNVVKALGLSYKSLIVFKNAVKRPSPDEAQSTFVMIDSDGTTKSVDGGWKVRATTVGGEGVIYVEHYNTMLIAPNFPLQLQIMQSFGKADYERVMKEFGAAVQTRKGSR